MAIKLPKITDLLGAIGPGSVVKFLPQILDLALGGGDPKKKALSLFTKKADAQAGRSAGKVLAFQCHKAISAVAGATPADKRAEVVEQFCANLALQLVQIAESVLAFGPLAVQREVTRGKGDAAETAALSAREAGEEALVQDGLDAGRFLAGDAPKD